MSITGVIAVLGLVASVLVAPAPAEGAVLPSGFSVETVASGFDSPTSVAFADDGTMFISEKRGVVLRLDGPDDSTPVTVLDLRTSVHNNADRGLTALAVDPDFPASPYVYIGYSLDRLPAGGPIPAYGTTGVNYDPCPDSTTTGCPALSRISRLDISNGASEVVLFEGHCQQFPFHTVGDLLFDTSGDLIASFGDGSTGSFVEYGQRGNLCGDPPGPVGTDLSAPTTEGGQARAQDLLTRSDPTGVHGAVLRVDKSTFAPVASNPLAGDGETNVERILGIGFRNPFRAAVDSSTGRIYVGNVGGAGREEIQGLDGSSLVNSGWPCYEGTGTTQNTFWLTTDICQQLIASGDHDEPLYQYLRNEPVVDGEPCSNGGLSISGLAVNRSGFGTSGMDGALFFTDYTRDCIWYLPSNGTGGVTASPVLFASAVGALVDLGFGPDGRLYGIDILGERLVRYSYGAGEQPPVAAFTATPSSGPAPLNVTLDASSSFDPNPGDTLSYSWDTDGDGSTDATGVTTTVTYTTSGTHSVGLTVLDSTGLVGTATSDIIVGGVPNISVTQPAEGRRFKVGAIVPVKSSATSADGSSLPSSASSWELILHHCIPEGGCHTHGLDGIEGANGTFVMPDHEYPSNVELVLTVEDPSGGSAEEAVDANYRTVDLDVTSEPSGLTVLVGSTENATPFTREVAIAATTSVSVSTPQSSGGALVDFSSWRFNGAAAGTSPGIELAPTTDSDLVAVFLGGVGPDTERPTPPRGLAASGTSGGVSLSWRASTDNVGIANYLIYRSTDGTFGQLYATVGDLLEWTDTATIEGTAYTYGVKAQDGARNTSWRSNLASAVAGDGGPVDTERPSPPRGLQSDSQGSGIQLSWIASTDNVGVTNYLIYRSTDGSFGPLLATVGTVTQWTDASASLGVAYTYGIKARDGAGNTSWRSNLDTTTFAG